jgi:hypothetical protein
MWLKARQHGLGNRPKAVKLVEDIYLLWLLAIIEYSYWALWGEI